MLYAMHVDLLLVPLACDGSLSYMLRSKHGLLALLEGKQFNWPTLLDPTCIMGPALSAAAVG